MNALKKLKELSGKQYLGFAKLTEGYHLIKAFRVVKNKFGKKSEGSGHSIMVEINDQVLFLPQYFRTILSDADVKELNSSIEENEKVYLFFGGRIEDSK